MSKWFDPVSKNSEKKWLSNGSDLSTRLTLSLDITAHFLHQSAATQDWEFIWSLAEVLLTLSLITGSWWMWTTTLYRKREIIMLVFDRLYAWRTDWFLTASYYCMASNILLVWNSFAKNWKWWQNSHFLGAWKHQRFRRTSFLKTVLLLSQCKLWNCKFVKTVMPYTCINMFKL